MFDGERSKQSWLEAEIVAVDEHWIVFSHLGRDFSARAADVVAVEQVQSADRHRIEFAAEAKICPGRPVAIDDLHFDPGLRSMRRSDVPDARVANMAEWASREREWLARNGVSVPIKRDSTASYIRTVTLSGGLGDDENLDGWKDG